MEQNTRIGPRHPRLGNIGFRVARWLAAKTMAAAGFHQLGSEFCNARIAHVRAKLARGETVYLAGLGAPGTHNSGLALVEVTQAHGPRLIVNNEEERFSGNKHTTEYPKMSIDAAMATLREMGRDVGDIDAWLTSWDYPTLAGTLARSVLEELPPEFQAGAHHGGRRLRRPPPRPDDADAKNPRPTARACRACAADMFAASRQPRLVFVCRLALRR